MKIHSKILIYLLLAIPTLAWAWTPESLIISGTWLYGPMNGFVQIPDGGRVGTSSPRRPTLSDLGIDHSNNYDFAINVNWHNFSLYGGYQYLRPNASTTLDDAVITHGVFIPKGADISTNLKFDYYRVGSKYNFYLLQNKLILAPLLEFNVLNFGYDIPDFITPRDFNQVTTRIGLYGAYYFKPQFFIDTTLASSIPIFNLNLVTANIKLNYTFFNKAHVSPTLFIGGEYTYLDFEDSQSFPNHMQFTQPAVLAGLNIKFS